MEVLFNVWTRENISVGEYVLKRDPIYLIYLKNNVLVTSFSGTYLIRVVSIQPLDSRVFNTTSRVFNISIY